MVGPRGSVGTGWPLTPDIIWVIVIGDYMPMVPQDKLRNGKFCTTDRAEKIGSCAYKLIESRVALWRLILHVYCGHGVQSQLFIAGILVLDHGE